MIPGTLDGGYLRLAMRLADANMAESHPELSGCELFPVWQCKALSTRKYIIAAPKARLMFEVTYDGAKDQWYVDRYAKEENVAIAGDHPSLFASTVSVGGGAAASASGARGS